MGDERITPSKWTGSRLADEMRWLQGRLREDLRPQANRFSNKANDCGLGDVAVHLLWAEECIAQAQIALDRALDSGSSTGGDR